MTDTNSTSGRAEKLQQPAKLTPEEVRQVSDTIPSLVTWIDAATVPHLAQTKEAAREAGKLLQLPRRPVVAEGQRETIYLETGAGLALSLGSDGCFTLAGLTPDGRELIRFTHEETQALYSFWWSVCAPGIVEHLPAAVAYVEAKRAQEETNGHD